MNIKRAFLAAVAVLVMVPGLAMAQTNSIFPGNWGFSGAGGPDVDFDLTLTCTGGTPLQQTVSVGADTTINFTVVGISDIQGATCSFSLAGLPTDGWELDDNGACEAIAPSVDGPAPLCEFEISPTPFNFWADLIWDAIGEGSEIPVEGSLSLTCNNVWDGEFVTTVSDSYSLSADGLYQLDDGVYAPVWTASANDSGATKCSAILSQIPSAVSVENCSVVVQVGDPYFLTLPNGDPNTALGEVIVCEVEATVFFEGIPTLSQYGMAIMVLLMLGVGFVGFRRFV